jgi:cleavage stimulation factor subunit 3
MMEFHSNKDSAVAIKIFDLGAKKFPNEVDYVIKHLQFLLSINDDTSEHPFFVSSAERERADNRCSCFV